MISIFRFLLIAAIALAPAGAVAFGGAERISAFGYAQDFVNPAYIASVSEEPIVFVDSSGVLSNDIIPVTSYFSKFKGERFSGRSSKSEAAGNYGITFAIKNWSIGYSKYSRDVVMASGDTIRFLQDLKYKHLSPGRVYKIEASTFASDLDIMHVSFGRDFLWQEKTGSFGITFNLVNGRLHQNGGIAGTVTTVNSSTNTYLLNATSTYGNQSEKLGVYGDGYSVDVGGKYDISDDLEFEALLENVTGIITWRNMYMLDVTGNSDNIVVNPDGSISVHPSLSGYEKHDTYLEKPEFVPVYGLNYSFRSAILGFFIEPHTDLAYYAFSIRFPVQSCLFSAGYGSRFNAFSIGADMGWFSLGLMMDNVSLIDAKTLGVYVSFTY